MCVLKLWETPVFELCEVFRNASSHNATAVYWPSLVFSFLPRRNNTAVSDVAITEQETVHSVPEFPCAFLAMLRPLHLSSRLFLADANKMLTALTFSCRAEGPCRPYRGPRTGPDPTPSPVRCDTEMLPAIRSFVNSCVLTHNSCSSPSKIGANKNQGGKMGG
jgi:hypothetical protein